MGRFWCILFALIIASGCRSREALDERSAASEELNVEKVLSGTDGTGKGDDTDSDSTDTETDSGKDDGKDDGNQEPDVDPDADPDDHTNVDLDNCFQKMPLDRDPGPFFKEEKVVTGWGKSKRTQIKLVPIEPPPPGLNLCKTILDECIVCTPWEVLKPEKAGDENACDDYAETCSTDLGKECKCVRS